MMDIGSLEALIDKGRQALRRILPAECVQRKSSKNRRYDAALLFLIYPLEVVDESMADRIIADVTGNLQGDYGVRRYIGDSFWAPDYKKKLPAEKRTSYTGDNGLHETIEKGESLLKEASVIREKKILQKFFDELQKPHGLVAYGLNEVIVALESGAVDTVIISEDTTSKEVELECQCGTEKKFVTKEVKEICERCNQVLQKLGERDIIEAFEEKVKQYTQLAEDYKLIITGGSDFHGISPERWWEKDIAAYTVPYSLLKKMKQKHKQLFG